MNVIKELCAWLPVTNPRGVWGEFNMREYLSITSWEIEECVADPAGNHWDVKVSTTDGLASFIVRSDWIKSKAIGFYWSAVKHIHEADRRRSALLFDLAYTKNMQFKLMKNRDLPDETNPDAGSW